MACAIDELGFHVSRMFHSQPRSLGVLFDGTGVTSFPEGGEVGGIEERGDAGEVMMSPWDSGGM